MRLTTKVKTPSDSFVSQARKAIWDGELCLNAATKELCSDKVNLFKTICVLARTIVQRVEDTWSLTSVAN